MSKQDHQYDNLHIAARIASGFDGVLAEAQKVAENFRRGGHPRKTPGDGESFWQFRDYAAGDARRDIDWRQSAKRDRVYVRQRERENTQTVYFYRDASRSMQFRSKTTLHTKKDYAEILLLALAMLTLEGGERVALLGVESLMPVSHASAIGKFYEHLAEQEKRSITHVPSYAHMVLMSDFFEDAEHLRVESRALADRGIKAVLVQVCDPAEENLEYEGRIRFLDAEDDTIPALDIAQVQSIRTQYREKFLAHRSIIAENAAACGWRFLPLLTSTPPEEALAQILSQSERI